jgi:Uma2 family endonuclease
MCRFLRMERARVINPDQDIPGAPDLAIEVVSPSDKVLDLHRKIRQYFAAGAVKVWVIDPIHKFAEIWMPPGRVVRTVSEDEHLESSLIPGFSLRLGEIFVLPQPATAPAEQK